MVDLGDIAAFVAVVEAGGFTEAARRRHTTKSALSRRVAALEAKLGVSLLERHRHGMRPNEVGAVYYAKCVRILDAMDAASDFAAGFGATLSGRIAMAVERDFMLPLVAPVVAGFMARHPEIRVEIRVEPEGRPLDGVMPELRLQLGEASGKQQSSRRMLRMARVLCASPGYVEVHGMPADCDALERHQGLLEMTAQAWWFARGDVSCACRPIERLRSSESGMLLSAALAGLGIALLPEVVVADALADGRLLRLLPDWTPQDIEIHAVHDGSRRGSKKLQVLLDALAVGMAGGNGVAEEGEALA